MIHIYALFGVIFGLLALYFISVTIDLIRERNRDWMMSAFYASLSSIVVLFIALFSVWKPL